MVIKYARGLRDTDGSGKGDSDPYTKITAYSTTGYSKSFQTHRVKGNENPNWNSIFNAGCNRKWSYFYFKVWDNDSGPNDPLSSGQFVYLTSLPRLPACRHTVTLTPVASGTITFDIYYYTWEGNGSPGSC